MPFSRRWFFAIIALALSGCGGGGGATPSGAGTVVGGASATPTPGANTPQSVQLNVHIPGVSTASAARSGTASARRSPQFVASSTEGVLVVVYATSDTNHTTPLGSSGTNVSPGSAACGGASGARTCSISIPAPPGLDDFVFTTYDQPPSSGTTFPGNANILSTGTVIGQTIQTASANVVNVTLSGTLTQLRANPGQFTLLAGAGNKYYSVEYAALDADNNIILGPFNDPITVTVQETGGSGYTSITTAGPTGTGSSTATVNSSSDVVTVLYTGGGSGGYFATLRAVAQTGQTSAPTFDPLFLSSVSSAYSGGPIPSINLTTPDQSMVLNYAEANWSIPASVSPGNCSGVVTFGATTPGSGSGSVTITASSAGGSCTANFGDGYADTNIAINAVGNTTATLQVPGSTLVYAPDGPSGVSIRTETGNQVGGITTASSADDLALDDAGNAYIGTAGVTTPTVVPGSIAKYTPSTTGYPPTYTKSSAVYTLTYPAYLVYVSASGAGELVAEEINPNTTPTTEIFDVWNPGATGAPSYSITESNSYGAIFFGVVAHDGTLYAAQYVACGSNTCVQYNAYPPGSSAASRSFLEAIVPQANQSGFNPNYATVGPDGTLYVTEWTFEPGDTNAGVYIYPPTGPERTLPNQYWAPNGIDLDANGNIYVVQNNAVYTLIGTTYVLDADTEHQVDEFSPTGTLIKASGTPADPYPLTVSPDGTAFYTTFVNPTWGETAGVYLQPTGAGTASTLIDTYGAYDVVIYDGVRETTAHARAPLSIGSGAAHGGSFSLHRRR